MADLPPPTLLPGERLPGAHVSAVVDASVHQRTVIPRLPATLGRFELQCVLGAGSSGTVYAATDLGTGQQVALKLLDRVDRARVEAFRAEYRVSGGLAHPNVVTPFELVEADGAWFIVMDRVYGTCIDRWIRSAADEGDTFQRRFVVAMTQLVGAVTFLHDRGIAHLDLKPANVLVSSTERVVVVDFGLAAERASEGGPEPVFVGGTPPYAAPEQLAGTPGPAADWYAVGVLLFEALTGECPRDGGGADDRAVFEASGPGDWAVPLMGLLPCLLDPDPRCRATGESLRRALAALDVGFTPRGIDDPPPPLSEVAERVLACLVVGGRPLPRDAFGVGGGPRDALRDLFRRALVVRTWASGREQLEATYLGRSWVDRHFREPQRAAAHREVAEVLVGVGAPVESIVPHWLAAGAEGRARQALTAAAEQASRGGDPARAADLYAILAGALAPGTEEAAAIAGLRGECLLRAGRSLDAAEVYESAATSLPLEVSRTWRARAVGAWLQGGDMHRGCAALATTLTLEGLPPPRRGARAAMSILACLVGLMVPWSVAVGPPGVRQAAQVDLLWAGGRGLSAVVPEMGLELMLRSALLARRMGDGGRYTRVVAFLCMFFLQFRLFSGHARRVLDAAERTALETGDPRLSAAVSLWRAGAHVYAADWAALEAGARDAARRLSGFDDMRWERVLATGFVAWALQLEGDYRKSGAVADEALAAATADGDKYGAVLFAQYAAFAALAGGHLALARAHCSDVGRWDTGRYTLADFYGMFLLAHCELYEGSAGAALGRLEADEGRWRAAGGNRIALWRIDQAVLEARVRIRVGARDRHDRLRALARRLRRESRPDAAAQAAWIDGARALAEGRDAEAHALLDRARSAFQALGMVANAEGIRLGLARLRGEDPAGARARLAERGVADPDRWAALLTPLGPDAPPPRS